MFAIVMEIVYKDSLSATRLNGIHSALAQTLEFCAPTVCDEILIATHELFINSIQALQLLPQSDERFIRLTLTDLTAYLIVECFDNGPPIPRPIIDTYILSNHLPALVEECGRGLSMIKSLSQTFHYVRTGNGNLFQLTFIK